MSNVVARRSGRWVVAEIAAPRQVKRALREAIHPSKLLPEDAQQWLIHEAAWPAACAVFWYFQLSVEQDWAPAQAGREPTPLFPGPTEPGPESQRVRMWRPWRMRGVA